MAKPTLIDILNNETSYPYSLDDFATFLDQSYCLENLEFWLAARRYKYYAYNFYNSNAPLPPSLSETYISLLNDSFYDDSSLRGDAPAHHEFLKQKLDEIITTFILPNSPKEINIIASVREDLLTNVFSYNNYDPSILDVVNNHVFELMQSSSFSQFLLEAGNVELRMSSESESQEDSDNSACSSPSGSISQRGVFRRDTKTRKQKFSGLKLKEKYRKLIKSTPKIGAAS
ncbi:hypothetical protein Glove_144g67 [Diversispora epigaea]|uniref:RGS domain-containing protein n=1 Tax=Diversispora epigaea TaxID=1348612 RepID=A0A397IU55_9GLOM|nr:hypothetical protein Glove_144g67 [Diversispora epigaea]